MEVPMRFLRRVALAAAVVVGAAALAAAQPPGGGFGGFGFGGGSIYGTVAVNKALQEELKVTAEQKDKLSDVMKPIREKQQELRGLFTPGQPPSEDELKEMREKMSKLAEETKKGVEGVLKPEQVKRLTQINYQALGVRAFADKDVQAALKLTDAQKEKAKTITDDFAKETREMMMKTFQDFQQGGNPEEMQKKIQEMQKKREEMQKSADSKIEKELTADQKKKWKEMLGEKFDLTKLQFRPMRRDD